jgi:hypothetical protein
MVMMDIEELKKLVGKQYLAEIQGKPIVLPPEAKCITTIPVIDYSLHYLETVAGIELTLSSGDHSYITGYNVLDEQKFMWFTLRWS